MKITQIIERTTFLRPIFISNFNYFSIESHLGGGDDKKYECPSWQNLSNSPSGPFFFFFVCKDLKIGQTNIIFF